MSNLQTNSWLIDRRHMLRGLGSCIALPLLDCMNPIRAAAAATKAAPKPKRSVFIYIPNGVNTLDYQITAAGEGYEFSRTLKPLEKHRAHITPISGLHHPGGLGRRLRVGRFQRCRFVVRFDLHQVSLSRLRRSGRAVARRGAPMSGSAHSGGREVETRTGWTHRFGTYGLQN